MPLVPRKLNVKKLRADRDIDGLEKAIVWAQKWKQPEYRASLQHVLAKRVEREAEEALSSLVPELAAEGDIAGLRKAAMCGRPDIRRSAAQALVSVSAPEALDALVDAMGHEEVAASLRSVASEPATLARLRQMVEAPQPRAPHLPPGAPDPRRRLLVEIVLSTSAGDDPELLVALVRDEEEEIRKRAAEGLTRVGDPRSVEILLDAALEKRDDLLLAAAAEIASRSNETAVRSLDADLRRSAADWLLEDLRGTSSDLLRLSLEREVEFLRLLDEPSVEALADRVRAGTPQIDNRVSLAELLLPPEECERIVAEERAADEAERAAKRERILAGRTVSDLAYEAQTGFGHELAGEEAFGGLTSRVRGARSDPARRQSAARDLAELWEIGDEEARDALLQSPVELLQAAVWSSIAYRLISDIDPILNRWGHNELSFAGCSICGAELSSFGGKSVPDAEFRSLQEAGYDPALTRRAGPPWPTAAQSPLRPLAGWDVCEDCAQDIATFAAVSAKRDELGRLDQLGLYASAEVAPQERPAAEPVSQATVLQAAPVLADHGLVALATGAVGFELTQDGLLFADAMLGDRDCPDHPSPYDDLKAVSGEHVIELNIDQLVALAAIALGGEFATRVLELGDKLALQDSINAVLMRFASALAHATRHDRSAGWTPATPLAEMDLDAEAKDAFERQLRAGQPAEEIILLTRAVLESWPASSA